ncbi:MAG: hypothetical protein ABNH21_02625 [Glaciecola sp.]|jgi:hypothetical protein
MTKNKNKQGLGRASKLINKVFMTLFIFTGFIVISYLSIVKYVDSQLASKTNLPSINACLKVWSTRGLVTEPANRLNNANSIQSITHALNSGAQGVEIDVFFDVELDRFIVSHDRPYNLKNGHILTLSDVFSTIDTPAYYWLDFKKLTRLNESQVNQAVARLSLIVPSDSLRSNIYIESEHPIKLPPFQDKGFRTILDTQPLPVSFIGTRLIHNLYKIVFYFGDYSVMGIGYGEIDDPVYNHISESVLNHVPLFIYHVPNERKLIQRLSDQSNVKVLLNSDETANLFDVTDRRCKDKNIEQKSSS